MARWRQHFDKETQTSTFVPIDDEARARDANRSPAVHGVIEPFRSPIDGTLIEGRRAYREHCKKHGVVPAIEFGPEHYERKAAERAKVFTGEKTKEEKLEIKKFMYEQMMRAERNGR